VPEWPLAIRASKAEAAAWSDLWGKPQAAAWAEHHLARTVARYVRALVKAERPGAQAFLLSEVRQLEAALGLNSMAMLRLRWEMAGDEVGDRRDQRESSASSPLTMVRPVDQAAGAGES
jgi:hypothetical protein